MSLLESGRRWYRLYVTALSCLHDVLLLIVRLYWGGNLVISGWRKFADFEGQSQIFENLGVIWPRVSLAVSGAAELGCGALLVIGLAARLAALPLVINMLVAFAVASGDKMQALFTHPNEFVTAPEFLYLFACLLVLVFGPGLISVDALFGVFLGRLPPVGSEARGALQMGAVEPPAPGRREFAKLAAAALGGLVAGLVIRRAAAPPGPADEKSAGGGSARGEQAEKGRLSARNESVESKSQSAEDADIAAPPNTDLNLLVAGDRHVCRGLNTCKEKGKDHKNACAGQAHAPLPRAMPARASTIARGRGAAMGRPASICAAARGPAPSRSKRKSGSSPAKGSSSSPRRRGSPSVLPLRRAEALRVVAPLGRAKRPSFSTKCDGFSCLTR